MAIYEVFAFLIAVVLLVIPFTKLKSNNHVLALLTALLVALNTLIIIKDGILWRYIPLYIFTVIIILLFTFKKSRNKDLTAILFLLVVLSVTATALFPTYQIPKPTGDFLIGTKTYDVVDKTRVEQYNDLAENRKFNIQVWYPTDSVKGLKQADWLNGGRAIARELSKDVNLPYFVLDQLAGIKSNSYINAKISQQKSQYPLIILSHGWAGIRNLHQDIAEELASQGYVVVGIEHTYGSVVTRFNSGELATINYAALPKGDPNYMAKANQLVNTYADDVSKTIDYMLALNENDDTFLNKIDINHIGVIGHSTGGGGDVAAAIKDARIKALIGLDAWVEPLKDETVEKGLAIPALFLRSEQWAVGPNNKHLLRLHKTSQYQPQIYQIDQTTHYDFAMVYMYSSATKLFGFSGEIDSAYLAGMLKDITTSFFDQTLNNNKNSQIEINQYKEVTNVIIK